MPADTHERMFSGTQLRACTPGDATDLKLNGVHPRGFMIGGAGNVSVIAVDDTVAVTITAPVVGVIHPIAARRIMGATTATGVVLVY